MKFLHEPAQHNGVSRDVVQARFVGGLGGDAKFNASLMKRTTQGKQFYV